MGYSTDFKGVLTFQPQPSAEVLLRLIDLEGIDQDDDDHGMRDMPDSYNQWELTRDRKGLHWDGGEKFYFYAEWLQYLHDTVLAPEGVTLVGEIRYQGEEIGDAGTISVQNGQVVKCPASFAAPEQLATLQAFWDFVKAGRYGPQIMRDFAAHQISNPQEKETQ